MSTWLLLLSATILWGLWGVADKIAVSHAHPFTVQWMYSLPYALLIPVWYRLGQVARPEANHSLPALGWALAASLCSMFALVLILQAMRRQPASLAVGLTAAYPMVTVLVSAAVGLEDLTFRKILAMGVIIGGIILLQE